MACLDNETATAYLRGDFESDEADRWAAHLAACDACRRQMQEVSALIDGVRRDLLLAYDSSNLHLRPTENVIRPPRATVRRLVSPRSLRPHFVGAGLATAVAFTLLMVWWRETPVTAAEALRRAAVAEQATASNLTAIVHRSLAVEERRGQAVVRRQRVEIWQNAANRTKVRRVYDGDGRLVAGEWTRSDGSRSVYRPPQPPIVENADTAVPLNAENAWRWEPSVQPFMQATPSAELSLDRRDDSYLLGMTFSPDEQSRVVSVALTLDARDFRPVAQTMVIAGDDGERELALVEHEFEALHPDRVQPTRFAIERELLPAGPVASTSPAIASPPARRPPSNARAEPPHADRLAMKTWYQLHSLGLIAGRNAFVERTATGRVRVDVTVASELRRLAIVRRLEPFAVDKALDLNVRVAPDSTTAAVPPEAWSNNPTYIQIRSRVLATLPERDDAAGAADIIAHNTVRWMRDESQQIQGRIEALSRFSAKWSADRLRNLDLDTLAEWQTIIRDQAVDAGQRAESLLQRYETSLGLPPVPAIADDSGPVSGPADVGRLVERLARLASSQSHLFTAALSETTDVTIDRDAVESRQFRLHLAKIAAIAASIAGPWPLGR